MIVMPDSKDEGTEGVEIQNMRGGPDSHSSSIKSELDKETLKSSSSSLCF